MKPKDYGCYSDEQVDYPDFIKLVAYGSREIMKLNVVLFFVAVGLVQVLLLTRLEEYVALFVMTCILLSTVEDTMMLM